MLSRTNLPALEEYQANGGALDNLCSRSVRHGTDGWVSAMLELPGFASRSIASGERSPGNQAPEEQLADGFGRSAMCCAIDTWRDKHNHHRPHRALGYLPPTRAVEVPNCRLPSLGAPA